MGRFQEGRESSIHFPLHQPMSLMRAETGSVLFTILVPKPHAVPVHRMCVIDICPMNKIGEVGILLSLESILLNVICHWFYSTNYI